MTTASHTKRPGTNARIVCLLEEVKAELARTRKHQEQQARDLARLLGRVAAQLSADSWGGWADESALRLRTRSRALVGQSVSA